MGVIQVVQCFPPDISGDGKHVYEISKRLVDRGYKVIVYTSIAKNDALRSSLLRQPAKKYFEENVDGIFVKRFNRITKIGYTFLTPKIFSSLLKERADLIHAHACLSSGPFFAALASRHKNIPFIYTAHGSMRIASELNKVAEVAKTIYDYTIGSYIIKSANKLVALTEENIPDYVRLGGKKENISIIPNGVDLNQFQILPSNRDFKQKYELNGTVLLFVGRLEKHKGVQYLLEAFKLVLEELPDTNLLIVGDGSYRYKLIMLARHLRVIDKVIFTGFLPQEELLKVYCSADIFVFPSRHEGFGIVLLEAMAMGLPIVAFKASAMQYIIKENVNGLLAKPFDYLDLANIIVRLISDEKLRAKLGKNNKKVVREKYTWSAVVDKIEDVYTNILTTHERERGG